MKVKMIEIFELRESLNNIINQKTKAGLTYKLLKIAKSINPILSEIDEVRKKVVKDIKNPTKEEYNDFISFLNDTDVEWKNDEIAKISIEELDTSNVILSVSELRSLTLIMEDVI